MVNEHEHAFRIQLIVLEGVFLKIRAGEFKERGRRPEAVFLQMHEGAGQLDEPFVERPVRPQFIGQPEVFQDIMGFVKELVVETVKIARVMRVHPLPVMRSHHCRDACAFASHILNLTVCGQKNEKI